MKRIGLAVLILFFNCQALWAITIFQFKMQDLSESAAGEVTIAADVAQRRLKLEPDASTTIIYRGDLPEAVMLMVDHEDKKTRALDRKQMQAVSNKMQQMMQQMQAQMKNLPPELQKRLANMQATQQPMPTQDSMGPKPTIKKTNKHDIVAKLPCTVYEMHDEQNRVEVCAAPWNKIKNGRASFELFQEMLAFQRETMQAMMSGMPQGHQPKGMDQSLMMGLDINQGFPVRVKMFEKDNLTHTGELQSFKEVSEVAPGFYDSPYETRPMMEGMQRRQRNR